MSLEVWCSAANSGAFVSSQSFGPGFRVFSSIGGLAGVGTGCLLEVFPISDCAMDPVSKSFGSPHRCLYRTPKAKAYSLRSEGILPGLLETGQLVLWRSLFFPFGVWPAFWYQLSCFAASTFDTFRACCGLFLFSWGSQLHLGLQAAWQTARFPDLFFALLFFDSENSDFPSSHCFSLARRLAHWAHVSWMKLWSLVILKFGFLALIPRMRCQFRFAESHQVSSTNWGFSYIFLPSYRVACSFDLSTCSSVWPSFMRL